MRTSHEIYQNTFPSITYVLLGLHNPFYSEEDCFPVISFNIKVRLNFKFVNTFKSIMKLWG